MSRAAILVLMVAVWPSGCSESAETVVAPSAPQAAEPLAIEQVQPPEGSAAGGPFATVIGSGFDSRAAVEVRFGDTPSPRTAVISETRLQVEIPAGAEGSVAITIRQGTREATLPAGFRYTAPAHGDGEEDHSE